MGSGDPAADITVASNIIEAVTSSSTWALFSHLLSWSTGLAKNRYSFCYANNYIKCMAKEATLNLSMYGVSQKMAQFFYSNNFIKY